MKEKIGWLGYWKVLSSFLSKYGWVFLLIFALLLAGTFRLYPVFLPVTDQWAHDTIQGQIKASIAGEILSTYPNLPEQQRLDLISSELQKVLGEQGEEILVQEELLSEQFKQRFQDSQGYTYLLAIDPYHWLRLSENFLANGHAGDVLKDGLPWNSHMLAPKGKGAGVTFHIKLISYSYKVLHFFNPGITPSRTAFFIPVLISVLAIIPCFFLVRKLAGDWSAFFASMLLAIHPSFLTRTVAGFADTDAYNVFFPLLVCWLFFEALTAKRDSMKYLFGGLSGFAVGLFALAWSGWWYIFDFLVGAIIIYFLYLLLRKKSVKTFLLTSVSFTVMSLLSVGVLTSFEKAFSFVSQALRYSLIDVATEANLWPNVLTTVAELTNVGLKNIIGGMGGNLLCAFAFLGIISLLIKKREYRFFALTLIIWLAGTAYMSFKGTRFLMLMAPAFCIAFGIGIGFLIKSVSEGGKNIKVSRNISIPLMLIIGLVLLGFSPIPPFCSHGMCAQANYIALNEVPSYTDAWHSTLTKIKKESGTDAIITSWWDFGHWFKWGSDRAVTFDGASQNTPQAHWVGKALLSKNENVSLGILRMLDCGGNKATELVNERFDLLESVILVNELILLDKDGAEQYLLNKKFGVVETENILLNTHCVPPESFVIVSSDMVGKSGVWGHFGSWNFERAKIWKNARNDPEKFMIDEMGYSTTKAQEYTSQIMNIENERQANTWISGWPGYYTNGKCSVIEENVSLECVNIIGGMRFEFFIDLQNVSATILHSTTYFYPFSVVVQKSDGLTETLYGGSGSLPYSLLIIPQNNGYYNMLVDPVLSTSTFTKLFFYNNLRMEHFERFNHERTLTGIDIYTYKTKWGTK